MFEFTNFNHKFSQISNHPPEIRDQLGKFKNKIVLFKKGKKKKEL